MVIHKVILQPDMRPDTGYQTSPDLSIIVVEVQLDVGEEGGAVVDLVHRVLQGTRYCSTLQFHVYCIERRKAIEFELFLS